MTCAPSIFLQVTQSSNNLYNSLTMFIYSSHCSPGFQLEGECDDYGFLSWISKSFGNDLQSINNHLSITMIHNYLQSIYNDLQSNYNPMKMIYNPVTMVYNTSAMIYNPITIHWR